MARLIGLCGFAWARGTYRRGLAPCAISGEKWHVLFLFKTFLNYKKSICGTSFGDIYLGQRGPPTKQIRHAMLQHKEQMFDIKHFHAAQGCIQRLDEVVELIVVVYKCTCTPWKNKFSHSVQIHLKKYPIARPHPRILKKVKFY